LCADQAQTMTARDDAMISNRNHLITNVISNWGHATRILEFLTT
jgi:hypothetical protein